MYVTGISISDVLTGNAVGTAMPSDTRAGVLSCAVDAYLTDTTYVVILVACTCAEELTVDTHFRMTMIGSCSAEGSKRDTTMTSSRWHGVRAPTIERASVRCSNVQAVKWCKHHGGTLRWQHETVVSAYSH